MYEAFARYYDCLTANVDYEKRADYFCRMIARHLPMAGEPATAGSAKGGLLLDLACGTGGLTFALAQRGWDVIGVDGSGDMLACAMQKLSGFRGEKSPLFLRQEMQRLDLFGTVDVCVCALDSLNHITDVDELEEVFKRLSLFVETGGLFVFDVNTPYKHRSILAGQAYVYEAEHVFCAWQNTLMENDVVEIDLDFFQREDNGRYTRLQEHFCERAYTREQLEAAGGRAGFEILGVYGADTFCDAAPDDERHVYVMENMTEHVMGKQRE